MKKNESYETCMELVRKAGFKSLSQFAKHIEMPKSSVSRYFNAERDMPAGFLVRICNGMNISPNTLLTRMGYEWK
jgi:hypothetical protein